MLYFKNFIIAFLLLSIFSSCKKDKELNNGCSANTPTVSQIIDAQATIIKDGDKFVIVEKGSIDTKLNPCSLPEDFRINNLSITVSGDVKKTPLNGAIPCCTVNFVISKISK